MMKKITAICLMATGFTLSWPLTAQEADKQCEIISVLTRDYFAQRLEGKSMEDMQENIPPQFIGSQFARQMDLAMKLAFTFDESLNEDQVETVVFDNCMRHHPGN